MHGSEEILFCRLAHGILLVVGQDDHVFSFVAKVLGEVARHVPHVIDTTPQLSSLAKIVYTDEKRFSPATAVAVPERIVLRSAMSEMLRASWGRRRRGVIAVVV